MTPVPQSEYVDVKTAAFRAGVKTQTIYRWMWTGRLPANKMGPKLWRIKIEDLDRLMRGGEK